MVNAPSLFWLKKLSLVVWGLVMWCLELACCVSTLWGFCWLEFFLFLDDTTSEAAVSDGGLGRSLCGDAPSVDACSALWTSLWHLLSYTVWESIVAGAATWRKNLGIADGLHPAWISNLVLQVFCAVPWTYANTMAGSDVLGYHQATNNPAAAPNTVPSPPTTAAASIHNMKVLSPRTALSDEAKNLEFTHSKSATAGAASIQPQQASKPESTTATCTQHNRPAAAFQHQHRQRVDHFMGSSIPSPPEISEIATAGFIHNSRRCSNQENSCNRNPSAEEHPQPFAQISHPAKAPARPSCL
ncbi:hypothetical protein Nepgr_005256 [Nepenthes gracilis]|uniref:Uncharacterized protein n=1 Tax=Nepenthes gracilis TaxID=150966 RepID=A0AAD3XG94_NEPGR|nr:hypothetical protein Nepgr_005256 [Nepenthes gracilis]